MTMLNWDDYHTEDTAQAAPAAAAAAAATAVTAPEPAPQPAPVQEAADVSAELAQEIAHVKLKNENLDRMAEESLTEYDFRKAG